MTGVQTCALPISLMHGGENRFLIPEVLVQRSDADAGGFGNLAGSGLRAMTGHGAKARFHDGIDGGSGAALLGFSGHLKRLPEQNVVGPLGLEPRTKGL